MAENVNIDLSGEINATTQKKGFQKYVTDMELIMQHIKSGAAPALVMGVLASRKPWTQFVATDNFKVQSHSKVQTELAKLSHAVILSPQFIELVLPWICGDIAPPSIPRLSRRFYRNVEYFQANYLMVFLGLFAYCLITTPLLLIAMAGSFFGYRKLTAGPNTLKIGGYELSKTQQYVVAGAGSMALCWLAGAGAVLFWVLGATVTVVALHASFFDAEALPASDDPEQFPMIEQV